MHRVVLVLEEIGAGLLPELVTFDPLLHGLASLLALG
jgi:hypothetical protein